MWVKVSCLVQRWGFRHRTGHQQKSVSKNFCKINADFWNRYGSSQPSSSPVQILGVCQKQCYFHHDNCRSQSWTHSQGGASSCFHGGIKLSYAAAFNGQVQRACFSCMASNTRERHLTTQYRLSHYQYSKTTEEVWPVVNSQLRMQINTNQQKIQCSTSFKRNLF